MAKFGIKSIEEITINGEKADFNYPLYPISTIIDVLSKMNNTSIGKGGVLSGNVTIKQIVEGTIYTKE